MVRKMKSDEELLALMPKQKTASESEIDLGILDGAAVQPNMAEKLYAERIIAGVAQVPDESDPSYTPGVRQLVAAATETRNQNTRLAELSGQGNSLTVAEPGEPGQQQLEVCLREFGLQSLTVDEFIQIGIEELNQATVRACRAGAAFWAAQEALKNTDCAGRSRTFIEWINDVGLTERRVYEAIAMAKFYARLPDVMRSKALTIGKKNALLLASLPQTVIDQAAESGNDLLEKADMMTVAELKEELKTLLRREKNYEAELERADNQIKRLSAAKTRTTDFLLRTEEIREECMALQLGGELHLNSLRKLFDDTDIQAPEGLMQAEQIWVVTNTLAARALDLLEYLQARCPEGMPERPMTRHMLSTAEAERWLLDYPLIENRFAAEQALRQEKRDSAKPKGPGRPVGSKNKASGE